MHIFDCYASRPRHNLVPRLFPPGKPRNKAPFDTGVKGRCITEVSTRSPTSCSKRTIPTAGFLTITHKQRDINLLHNPHSSNNA